MRFLVCVAMPLIGALETLDDLTAAEPAGECAGAQRRRKAVDPGLGTGDRLCSDQRPSLGPLPTLARPPQLHKPSSAGSRGGFDFLGYHFTADRLTLEMGTLANFVDRATRLYEQERQRPKGPSPLGPTSSDGVLGRAAAATSLQRAS